MRNQSIVANSLAKNFLSNSESRKHSLAKKLVLQWVAKLEYGCLEVFDDDQYYSFGQEKSATDLIATIHIHEEDFYSAILFNGTTGSGESYMQRKWTSPNLLNVIQIFVANIDTITELDNNKNIFKKVAQNIWAMATKNTLQNSQKNISAHYDIGNDLFALFLDPTMMYSAAIFDEQHQSLEAASVNKLDTICKKIQLTADDHIIEIGSGWGGFACHAAKHYGCKVTTTTISEEQFNYCQQRIKDEGLESQITVLFKDYRELEGSYDKLVSIEMIEAVGHQYYQSFFQCCNKLLKNDGIMLIQAITISDQRYHEALNSIDFIQRYIFPGGCLPCNAVITEHLAKDTNMQLADLHDITDDYATTLSIWRDRFFANIEKVKALGYNDVFIRMWEFYLCYCEGGFLQRSIQTSQFVMTKPHTKWISRQHK